jgi:hypothetical protein
MTLFQPVLCSSCGITFGVPREYFDGRVADGRRFTCPNACPVRLGLESSTDRMVRALDAAVVDLTEALGESRLIVQELQTEVVELRQAVVNQVMGAATAPETH